MASQSNPKKRLLQEGRSGRDPLTARQRSELMGRISSKDTKPEMMVRRLVHGMGYRYRLHARELPGRPDLVFRPRRKAIFVHGCFWHRHPGCSANRLPTTRREFWQHKLDGNVHRDRRNKEALEEMGWHVLVVWECETKDFDHLANEVRKFLGPR
ncbi:MAG: very short patch repair endonuclease [Bacteroidetes bacterium]|nr:very short patch repair endonuclease [Bacteroidota bacterium]